MDRLRAFDSARSPAVRGWNLATASLTGHVLPLLAVALSLALVDFAVVGQQAAFLALVVAPLAGLLVLGVGWVAATNPADRPPGGTIRFKHQVPERYHEEFSRETLEQVVEEDDGMPPALRYLALFFAATPAHSVLVVVLFAPF